MILKVLLSCITSCKISDFSTNVMGRTPHDSLELFIEEMQARVIQIRPLELAIYSLYFVIKILTIGVVVRSVAALNQPKSTCQLIYFALVAMF